MVTTNFSNNYGSKPQQYGKSYRGKSRMLKLLPSMTGVIPLILIKLRVSWDGTIGAI